MTDLPTCDVCVGTGAYPIINSKGQELYSIRCPECFGHGNAPAEVETETDEFDLPPVSSAARIQSMADLRKHIVEHWATAPIPQQQNTTQEKT